MHCRRKKRCSFKNDLIQLIRYSLGIRMDDKNLLLILKRLPNIYGQFQMATLGAFPTNVSVNVQEEIPIHSTPKKKKKKIEVSF